MLICECLATHLARFLLMTYRRKNEVRNYFGHTRESGGA